MNVKMHDDQVDIQIAATMESLLSELSHYRQQSEKLRKINTLYQRMAGILDLPAMIEAYSIWLMEFVGHDLIGYHNPDRQRMHMFCSYHGPKRRQAIQLAQEILERPLTEQPIVPTQPKGFRIHQWEMHSDDCRGLMVILRKGKALSEEELQFIDESLAILADPLKRALEYEEIFAQARRDSLTGLPNRFVFEERIGSIVEQARRHGHPLTLAALDLDHFKAVNDNFGHVAGDHILREMAALIRPRIRKDELFGRYGGEEFMVILPETDCEKARHFAESLRVMVESHIFFYEGVWIPITISVGVAQFDQDKHSTMDVFIEAVDKALYKAKGAGRNRVCV